VTIGVFSLDYHLSLVIVIFQKAVRLFFFC